MQQYCRDPYYYGIEYWERRKAEFARESNLPIFDECAKLRTNYTREVSRNYYPRIYERFIFSPSLYGLLAELSNREKFNNFCNHVILDRDVGILVVDKNKRELATSMPSDLIFSRFYSLLDYLEIRKKLVEISIFPVKTLICNSCFSH